MELSIENIFTCSEVFKATENRECKDPWTFFIQCGSFKTFLCTDSACECGYKTQKLAKEQKQFFLDTQPYKNHIAVVLKNRDFTEGRGPMIFDKVFASPDAAHKYVVQQDGICSSTPQGEPTISFGVNINNGLFGSVWYNGYEILLEQIN